MGVEVMDLKRSVPEAFPALVKAMSDMKVTGSRQSKGYYWNMGRYIARFMDEQHKDKYGRNTMEILARRLDYEATTLYTYHGVYVAYASDRSFSRVLKRDKVSPYMLKELARLPTDRSRDQVEKRIQSAKTTMTVRDVRSLISKIMGVDRQAVDRRTRSAVTTCIKLYEQVDRQGKSMLSLLNKGIQAESSLAKSGAKGEEIPKTLLKRRVETRKLIAKLNKATEAYEKFVAESGL